MTCVCGRPGRTKKGKECGACRMRRVRTNPKRAEENRRRVREWQLKFPEKRLAQRLKLYGLSVEEYRSMESRQGGVCAICKLSDPRHRLSVDHDHGTDVVRGLLCSRCNLVLGRCGDSIELFQRTISYLEATWS